MKVFELVSKKNLVIGEPYYLSDKKMVYVGRDKDTDGFYFYPLESHDFLCWEDGTVGFHDPLIYEEV